VNIFHFSIFSLHHWCKALRQKRSPITPLETYFSKSRLMAGFELHKEFQFHKKEDVFGDLEVPDYVLSFFDLDALLHI